MWGNHVPFGCESGPRFENRQMLRVLIIDDDPISREWVNYTLMNNRFETLLACDGREGVGLARLYLPEIIVCDVQMPEMDGFEVLETLRSDARTSSIPFIFITAQKDAEGIRRGMECGADDYICKPFTSDSLLRSINVRILSRQRSAQEAQDRLQELCHNLTDMLPHELNTPLSGILGCGELIADSAAELAPEEIGEMGRGIVRNARRLQELIQRFLKFSKIEILHANRAAVMEVSRSLSFPVSGLLEELSASIAGQHGRSGDLQSSIESGRVMVSEEHLGALFSEILDNAFKFSRESNPVKVFTCLSSHLYSIMVSDQGPGMTREEILRIGPHTQFRRKEAEQQGAGLGLAMAKRLTDLYGGHLVVSSENGTGTCVTVGLPLARGAPELAAVAAPADKPAVDHDFRWLAGES